MIGADYRSLCTEDPDKDTLLPADDNAWDNGVGYPRRTFSMLPMTDSLGLMILSILAGSGSTRAGLSLKPKF